MFKKLILNRIKYNYVSFRFLPRGIKPPEVNLAQNKAKFFESSPKYLTSPKFPLKARGSETDRQFRDEYDDTDYDKAKWDTEMKANVPPPGYYREDRDESNPSDIRQRERFRYLKRGEIPVEDETLLTWSAMDQIRELHESNSRLWTPEKIADSFPISEEGARRFLSKIRNKLSTTVGTLPTIETKKPTNCTSETIRKHDELVEKRWRAIRKGISGVVSEKTLFMIEQGFIKFLPMRSFLNEKNADASPQEEKIEIKLEDSNEIQPFDGPFTKLYKRHLQWKNAEKNRDNILNEQENELKFDKNGRELFKSVVFSKETEQIFDQNNSMMFDDFEKLWKQRIKSSNNRVDRKYNDWMNKTNKKNR